MAGYDVFPTVNALETPTSDLIVDSFHRNRHGNDSYRTSSTFNASTYNTPTNCTEIEYENTQCDGVLYAHTLENCTLVLATYDDGNLTINQKFYTAVLTPYVAYTSPDGYGPGLSPCDWHTCQEGSYGWDLQHALRSVYAGIYKPNAAVNSTEQMSLLTEPNQPFPNATVYYRPGCGFAMTLYLDSAAATKYIAVIANHSPWLQKAHWTHCFGRMYPVRYNLSTDPTVQSLHMYVIGHPQMATNFDTDPYVRCLLPQCRNGGQGGTKRTFGSAIASHEPYLAPTRYLTLSCAELCKRRTIPCASSNPNIKSNTIAVLHYDYRGAGKVNELSNHVKKYSRIHMNTAQEAPQNITFELRDEFGTLVRSCSFYSYWGDQTYFYNVGESYVFSASLMPLSYQTTRYNTIAELPFGEFVGEYPALSDSYYKYLYQILTLICNEYPPPVNALCTDAEWTHFLIQHSV